MIVTSFSLKSTAQPFRVVKDINSSKSLNNNNFTFQQLTASNGILYFTAATAEYGIELWKSDGTEAATG